VTKVLVNASSAIARAGLEALLREDHRVTLVGSASGIAAVPRSTSPRHAGAFQAQIREAHPDVLLIEIASSEKLDLLAELTTQLDAPPVILLSDHLNRAELRRALHNGVRAVLPRDAASHEILAAIEAVSAGLTVLSSEDMDVLLPAAAEALNSELGAVAGEALSSRETEVLTMLAEGLGNKDIAARLNISEHTVKFHVSSILGKLGAASRGEAVARGIREGLIVL
jgi:two-component system, NarL family, response regulator YdfI